MKEILFISDFDGTLTQKDFYKIVLEKYLGEAGQKLKEKWQNGDLTVFEFLESVFKSINRSESEIWETIKEIPFDKYAKTFIEHIKASGMDFLILSAGTNYYIEKYFAEIGIIDIPIIANKGVYKDKGILMLPDPENPFFSEKYGIDKFIAVQKFKNEYQKVFYAGDSKPDLKAAMLTDLVFAKGQLKNLLMERNHPFIPFDSVVEIEEYLVSKGLI
jgi:2-hydroxy-3-keto-5-methylthiopentenyl-1-phosphate phosphatase